MDKLVISVGTALELLWLREAVLKNAGFRVLTIADENQALAQVGSVGCGVLLVCYSIDDAIRQKLTAKFRQACPGSRIVAITNTPFRHPPVEADAFLYGVEGAEALITAVSQMPGTKAS
jgi:PleD family two-component response regulator